MPKCQLCPYQEDADNPLTSLKDHMFQVHKHCIQCNKTFKDIFEMGKHVQKVHYLRIKCKLCYFVSYDRKILNYHFESKHGNSENPLKEQNKNQTKSKSQ